MPLTMTPPADQRVLVHGVSWQTYESLLADFGDHPIRLTYDRGSLEIMSPSPEHESYSDLLAGLIRVLTLELNIPIRSCGSTTFRRQDLERGLEPDKCFYVSHEPQVRGRRRIDLSRDPPPDLAIEVDVTREFLDRLGIYAALGVPELWRFDGQTLLVYRLEPSGQYTHCDHSPTFPLLPLAHLLQILRDSDTIDETTLLRSFQTWVRQHLLPGQPNGSPASPQP